MAPRDSAVLSTTPLAASSGNEASQRTNKRPRRGTKLPERYKPDDPSYSSSAHTPSTSSPAPPTNGPIVAQGPGWYTILQPLKPDEKPETLRQARIRQGLPLKGDPPVIQRGKYWQVELVPADDEDSSEQQRKPVTPSRQRIRKDMVDKRPRKRIHQEPAKTYRGADAGDAMEVEMEQHDDSGAVGEETGQRDGADVLNIEMDQHDAPDPMELETTKNDGVVDTPASSPLSEPMSEEALEDLLRTPAEESETSEEELPPHPAFTGPDFTLSEFKYLEKHLRDNDALDVLKEVEPDFPPHQPTAVHALTPPPPASPPPAASSIVAPSPAVHPPSTPRPASLRPASLQPISSPPGGSPMDSPQAPSPSILTPPAASPHITTSPSASSPVANPRTTSPSPSPAPSASSPNPPPPATTSPSPSPPPPSPPHLPLLHHPAPSSSTSPSPPSLSQFHQQTPRGPYWSDWKALWAGSCYVPDHVRDILDTIPEDGPYFDVPAGQVQTVNALCADLGDPQGASGANYVVPGVQGRYMRTRVRGGR